MLLIYLQMEKGAVAAAQLLSSALFFLLSVMLPIEINRTTVASQLCLSFSLSE